MSKKCTSCNVSKAPETVPYRVFQDFKESKKADTRKWFIIVLVLIILLVGSNLAWLIYENSFEDVVITQEVEQDADNGENHFIGGDYNGETENQSGN